MFQKRLQKDKPIILSEFLYPLFQAYDSVAMDVDLEIGGNDQTFNMLRGRDLMNKLKNKEKFVLTTKLLEDPFGKKMGKTEGNAINLDDSPKNMYGKIMSWPDSFIFLGFELCTNLSLEQVEEIKKQKNNPGDDKAKLAGEIVSIHHSKISAQKAQREFNQVFKKKQAPSDIKTYPKKELESSRNIANALTHMGLVSSNSEAKRLVGQGAVRVDNKVINNWKQKIVPQKGTIIKVGKRRFIKLVE